MRSFVLLVIPLLLLLLQTVASEDFITQDDSIRGTTLQIIGDNNTSTPWPTTATTTTIQETEVPVTVFDKFADQFESTEGSGHTGPFQFANIFLIGGDCNDPSIWYSKWIDAGVKTIHNVTKVICAYGGTAYTRAFHLDALRVVEELAGDQLNETLVITVAVGLESDWSPVANLLRRGMSFFHAKEDPHNFNITEHGLSPENVLYFYFQWDERAAAFNSGIELCRLHKGAEQLKVAKLYSHGRNDGLNYRVDLALQGMKQACPDIIVNEVWTAYDNSSDQALQSFLTFKPVPDITFTCHDESAENFLIVAEKTLTDAQYSLVHTTGWDKLFLDLLDSRKILTTVDQLVLYPDRGLWKVISTVVRLIEENGLRTSKVVQDELVFGDDLMISSDTLLVSCDMLGYLHDNILAGYNKGAPPSRHVRVSTGLLNVTVLKMVPFDGLFEAALWLRTSWDDPRLQFDPLVHNGTLPYEPENIWTPALFYLNEIGSEILYTSPANVEFDGRVDMAVHLLATFLCPTTSDLRSFPFDVYDCAMELGAPEGITLDYEYGFQLMDSDPHFETEESIAVDPDHQQVIYYQLMFKRKYFTAYVRLILPAVLINFVGFMAFWIPQVQESVALGVTSMLCSLAFRETVSIPETSDVTWTEVFMMINIFYQSSVLFIIWCSYSANNGCSVVLDRFFQKIHPKKVQEAVTTELTSLTKIIPGESGHGNKNTMDQQRQSTIISGHYSTENYEEEITFAPDYRQTTLPVKYASDQYRQTTLPVKYASDHYRQTALLSAESSGFGANSGTNSAHSGNTAIRGNGMNFNSTGEATANTSSEFAIDDFSESDEEEENTEAQPFNETFKLHYQVDKNESMRQSRRPEGARDKRESVKRESMKRESVKRESMKRESIVMNRSAGSTHKRSSAENSRQGDPPATSQMQNENERKTRFSDAGNEYITDEARRANIWKASAQGKDKNDDDSVEEVVMVNVDWIGRWFIVPSYVIVMSTLIITGWGFTDRE